MQKNTFIHGIIIGAAVVSLLFFLFQKISGKLSEKEMNNDYYILQNQITKMNKMVVMEQDFSVIQKTKVTYKILGTDVSENEIMTFTKTNAQVSYDLNKMKIDVDSVNKKLIIREIPNAEIRITPIVEIKSMDDSFFNRIDEAQIKKVTKTAKEDAYKRVDQSKLRTDGRKQLLANLNNIFVLAKALNYEIDDQTNTLNLSEISNL